ncbi:hypothetical protein [Hymenobacter volaticus]|uniref:Uncharacterized protein n=1 Tax=Hymenobacter volaticus TaxID=2932254 RepID=A0ABY4GFF9_9BACT|nr:hypothetical protein [Hymenobacter volaticus]UOQ69618.1 hypothetical protein MUN86_29380 [Hymenobacter volaticus]
MGFYFDGGAKAACSSAYPLYRYLSCFVMALLSSARLRRNLERLQQLHFLPATEFSELELLEILAATIEDLHSLYPAHIPETKQYALLQQLAVLDLIQESQAKDAFFLTFPANWHSAQQALLQAIEFALAHAVRPATPSTKPNSRAQN